MKIFTTGLRQDKRYGRYIIIHTKNWFIRLGKNKSPLFTERYPKERKWHYLFGKRITWVRLMK